MDTLSLKISQFTGAIKKAIKCENWYGALSIALTLPDICGKLENPGMSSSSRYSRWFNEYMKKKYSMVNQGQEHVFINGNDAYALRCSYLHGGESNISQQRIKEVLDEFIFLAPIKKEGKNTGSHCIKINSKLQLRVDIFCNDICNAVIEWVKQNSKQKGIQKSALMMLSINYSAIIDGVHIT